MLFSIAMILIVGMLLGWICQKVKLPSLLGMLVTGMLLGPYVLNLLDKNILQISPDLRKIALIIILTRAGLGLDLSGLKKIGRPAVMMCFVPASFELIGIILLAPKIMGLTVLETAILGAVLAAVSPAVVVPRMVKLMEEGYGVKKGIPQLILAGASVDDVYVIVLFSTFTGMMQGQGASLIRFVNIPVSIFLGIMVGLLLGMGMAFYFEKVHIRDDKSIIIVKCIFLASDSRRSSYDTDHIFGIDRHYVYRYRLKAEKRSRCPKIIDKIQQALGSSRSLFVCFSRCYGQCALSETCRSESFTCYYRGVVIPYDRCFCVFIKDEA